MADNRIDVQRKIEAALAQIWGVDFAGEAATLLGALGYRSERTLPGQSGTVDDFLNAFPADNPGTKSEGEFRKQAASVNILFQVTDSEINEATRSQLSMFANEKFDKGSVRSFMFAAVELTGERYARGQYAAFTREVNKRFSSPAVVLFRTADGLLTLSFVHVRPNKRKPERDVLGSVSLIREVQTDDPHRAHIDILTELALEERLRWMDTHGKSRDFDGLLEAWLDALDTEELNRRFYRALKDWFDRAVKEAHFPTTGPRVLQPEEHVIRLITRLLFVWFVKEKGLVADELFIEAQVRGLLKDYDAASGDSYYRAVLQNLFFATLNTEIGRREFSSQANATHRDFSLYRYRAEMSDPDALFAQTPFINGGLFDCLDTEEATGPNAYRIDYFTDNIIDPRRKGHEYRALSIPNHLFFDNAGLITLFNHYKFTVEENTPVEQEVALDPELLGKVFENLLAAYNPETRESARKQTGSYYTPRAVVDYMVDEALVASLAQKARPDGGDASWWEELLHYLLDYNDAGELFDEAETDRVVRAIAGLRVLDPAVGSGAFPMGVLHKLTLALRRLDPDNTRWEALQKELAGERAKAAFDEPNQRERDAELDEISDTFERYRDSDFGRKLYLIQNSIYGVDIQPVACQIAKLRFFISLAIEQQPTGDRDDNFGIHPLPNLETRFVAANTLLRLSAATQIPLGGQNRVAELNDQLRGNRERHFHAGARQEKLRLRREDARLRATLAAELGKAGMSVSDANEVAAWDPYDQNAHANWFDAGYMFDITDGFDVVLGNPPYVVTKDSRLRDLYKEGVYGRMNTYGLFIQRGLRLTREGGQLTYINPKTMLTDRYFTNLRRVIRQQAELHGVVLITDRHNTFESVLQECIIPHLVKRSTVPKNYSVHIRSISRPDDLSNPRNQVAISSHRVLLSNEYDSAFYIGTSAFDYRVFEQMSAVSVRLADFGLQAETGKIQFDKYSSYAQPDNSNGACRLVWAENIQRYVRRPTHLRTGKEWLGRSITSVVPPNIVGSGIVTQRISANEQPRRIIATLINKETVSANNVYSENHTNFIPLSEGPDSAFVLGTLNSCLMEFVFRRLNSNTQVSAGEINSLPFPPLPDANTLKEIQTLVLSLLASGGVDSRPDLVRQAIADERRLDVLIGSLYGFSVGEVEQIWRSLPSYETVYGLTEENIAVAEGKG